jgi:enoyl-CoA hydratase/carnithine racemase
MADLVLTSRDAGILTVSLNRPDKRNAMNADMIGQLRGHLQRAAADDTIRVIVVRANGPSFCAGLDLRVMANQREGGEADLGPLEMICETLAACPQPTIAAVQGDAVAGGCELALYCDLRVAADNARFSMPLGRIGLAVPATLAWKLIDVAGVAKTYEMLFTGEAVGAETARDLGMANRVVPAEELDNAVRSLAEQIAQNAPLALRAMKAFVQRALEVRHDLRRDDLELLHRRVRKSADLKEGLAAQRERRKPTFRGN